MTEVSPKTKLAIRAAMTAMVDEIEREALTTQRISEIMTVSFGGTDAAGAWDWRSAFDVMQAAGLVAVLRAMERAKSPEVAQAMTETIASRLPTETRRSERQMQLQQFSTAMPWGWVVARAAQVKAGDTVLEPSAGVGCLAALTQAAIGSKPAMQPRLVLNEIDPLRRTLIEMVTAIAPSGHNAEFIDDLLDRDVAPSVVVMNPPFASSMSRSEDPTIAIRHVISAAKRLAAGGRLVAIVPPSVSQARGGALWARLCEEVTPVLRIVLPRAAFAKMGTSVETHLLIADKLNGSVDKVALPDCQTMVVRSPAEAHDVIERYLPPRLKVTPSRAVVAKPQGSARPVTAPPAVSASGQIRAALVPDEAKRSSLLLPGLAARQAAAKSSTAMVPLAITRFDIPRSNEAVSDVYARYAPQRIAIEGAAVHPTTLVESLAMASVSPPCPPAELIDLRLPDEVVRNGLLSDAQLETVIMAEAAFGCDLPGRFKVEEDYRLTRADQDAAAKPVRKGYFLGDGTGCGKGRQVAGLIMAGWAAGRRKAVWVSRSATLIHDAIRDWTDLGGAPTDIHALSKWSADETLKLPEGILFVTYATLRAVSQKGATRLEQVLAWLGTEFDGLIAFDEAHAMQNAGGGSNGRGVTAPSQQGLAGLRLQNALPRARVLYVSATGATEVANLAYAGRLGLWGSGTGYPFTSREEFVTAMEAGGVAAMEVVARDLKALGLYTARALSFDGVEYDILEHGLSADQITAYDSWARAFKTIHANLHAALRATGVTKPEGEGSQAGSSSAKAAAISAFESTKQRFFGHLLQGMKARSVIEAIEADIANGWAPVVQIVSTGEALLKRRIETLEPDEELAEASLTPREYVLGYLQHAFPVTQMDLVEQEDGSVLAVPLRDANGAPVISREAEAMRDRMIEDLMLLAPIPSALDQILWALGPERVAEVTGRTLRPIKQSDGRLKIERRAGSANAAEAAAFMEGSKDVLIFSDAGGTGRSYHASETAQNQKRRRHYLMEPGWRADNAIQGLGRTHRSAQVSAPFFRVCTTDVHGEKRFTSTIARRLDTLGALTKGQRETASQGMFRAEDNLESPIARGCLRALYLDIVAGRVEGFSLAVFEDWTGLRLVTNEGQLLEELPPIQRFLNRILALPIAMQNALFNDFMERIATATQRAFDAGRLDVGLEQLRGDRITAGTPQALTTDPETGAVTSLVPVHVEQRLQYTSAELALSVYDRLRPMENASSGKVALIAPAPRQVFDEMGELQLERRIIRPSKNSWISEEAFKRSQWDEISAARFMSLWDAEVAALPDVDVQVIYLLTGLILPIWKDIPGENPRIYRAACEDGSTYLGRALTEIEAGVLRGKFIEVDPADSQSILTAVMEGAKQVDLGRGLSLAKRRVAGNIRLEITGADRPTLDWLRTLGCFTEIHQFALRVFIPHGEVAVTQEIIAAIVAGEERHSVPIAAE